VQFLGVVRSTLSQSSRRLNEQLDRYRGHQCAKQDDTNRLNAPPSLLSVSKLSPMDRRQGLATYHWVLVYTRACSKLGCDEHHE